MVKNVEDAGGQNGRQLSRMSMTARFRRLGHEGRVRQAFTSGKQVLAFSSFFFLWTFPKEEKGREKDTFGSFGQKEEKERKRREGTLIPLFMNLF